MDVGFSRKGVTMKIFNLYGKSMDSTTNKTRCAMAGKTKILALLSLSLMFMVFTAISALAFKDGDSREYIENYMKEQCYHVGKAEGTGTGNTAGPNKTGVANTKAKKKSDSETKNVSEKKSDSKNKSVSEKMSGFDDDEDAISK